MRRITARAGLVNPSATYLRHCLRDNDEISPLIPEQILKAARMVERMISRRLPLRKGLVVDDC